MGFDTQSLEKFVKTDREAFRAQATEALRNFTIDDREHAASLETSQTTVDTVLRAWVEQLEPVYSELERKRADARIKNYLIRQIGFNDSQATEAVNYLVDERRQLLLDEVLANLYPIQDNDEPYQKSYAAELLAQTEADINDFFSHYIDFAQSVDAAEKYQIILCDPHGSWLERQKSALQIHKERQHTAHDEDERLDEITAQLEKLASDPESLLGHITANNWSFVTILDLRSKYQKQVDAFSKSDQKNPTKHLKLFERVTQSFRDREVQKLISHQHTHSLKALRQLDETIYNTLLEVFDLNATQRNRLLLDIQKHTRLSQERDLILLIQRNREQFLSESE